MNRTDVGWVVTGVEKKAFLNVFIHEVVMSTEDLTRKLIFIILFSIKIYVDTVFITCEDHKSQQMGIDKNLSIN
jgi:hypothetical protein